MGHEKALFEANEKMLKEGAALFFSLCKREDFNYPVWGLPQERSGRPSETEMWEKEDVWRMFCLREDYVNSEKSLLGSRTKKKLKEEEVQEIREDRERFSSIANCKGKYPFCF